MSPKKAWTMYPVSVWMLLSGFAVSWGVDPAAMATIIVSPIAREMPRIVAAATPDNAAGRTIRTLTVSLDDPSAYAPSRRDRGTADMASSATEAMIGTIMIP